MMKGGEEGLIMLDTTVDPLRILATLRAHGVSFIVVGELAAVARGSQIEFDGVDICLPQDDGNVQRLALALQHLGARRSSEPSMDEHTVSVETIYGRLDCVENPAWFAELSVGASEESLGNGVVARIAAIDDLARLSRASGDLSATVRLVAIGTNADRLELIDREPLDDGPVDAEPERTRRIDRIWKRLEDIDTFLTNLDKGELPKSRKRR
jgi:hypothetical protein